MFDFRPGERVRRFGIWQTHHQALRRVVGNFHPGAVQPEHLPHVADDVANGFVFEGFRQRALDPLLQVQVIDRIDLNFAPARPHVNFCLVGVAPIARRRHTVGLDL